MIDTWPVWHFSRILKSLSDTVVKSEPAILHVEAARPSRTTVIPLLWCCGSLSAMPKCMITAPSSCDTPWSGYLTSDKANNSIFLSRMVLSTSRNLLFCLVGFPNERTFQLPTQVETRAPSGHAGHTQHTHKCIYKQSTLKMFDYTMWLTIYQLHFAWTIKGGTNATRAHVLLVIHARATSNARARKEHYYTHLEISVLDSRDKGNYVIITEGHGREYLPTVIDLQDCPAKSTYVLETVRNIPEFEVQIGVAKFDMWVWSHMYTIIQPLKMSKTSCGGESGPCAKNPSDCVSGTPTGSGTTCLEVRGAFLTLPITFVILIFWWLVAGSMSLHDLETSLL